MIRIADKHKPGNRTKNQNMKSPSLYRSIFIKQGERAIYLGFDRIHVMIVWLLRLESIKERQSMKIIYFSR